MSNMKKLFYFSAVAVSGAMFVTTANAEWYLGAGQIPASNWYQIEDYSISTNTPSNTAPGIKFFSGYKASDLFSIELEYKDQMEFGVGNVFSGNELWLTDQRDSDLDSKALLFSGISTFTIDENKRLFFRGGLYNWDLKSNNQNLNEDSSSDSHGTDIFYSVGSYFDVTEKIGFSAEWERFEYDNQDVDFISTELHFNF